MADPLFITDLISQILSGRLRIPSFQRGFVWDADRVAHLMDSIYKGYPFGALLFWRTKTALQTERELGPYQLPNNDPDYPIDYILDGQQRATSIFGVFQNNLKPQAGSDDSWTKIYFDLASASDAQGSQFIYLGDKEVDPAVHFPLKILLDPPAYRRFLKTMDDSIAEQVDNLYRAFTTARIPVQTFATDDRTAVAIVFERINRLGVELDTLQLLSAWSWSDEFDLQEQFAMLGDDLSPFGFRDVGGDTDLLLRCCAAIISNDSSPQAIVELSGSEVRRRFSEVRKGVMGAVDFLRTNFYSHSTDVLPYSNILIPLSVFFATDKDQNTHPSGEQHKILVRWIWRTFFSRRYSKRLEQLNHDVQQVRNLRDGSSHMLGEFDHTIEPEFFDGLFNVRTTNTRTFILMLAASSPRDFVGGGKIALGNVLRECNKKEFHHVYPQAMLKALAVPANQTNAMYNFCMLPRAANNKISDLRPSEYRELMPSNPSERQAILRSALCPVDIFHDNFARFANERRQILMNFARELCS